MTKFFVDVYRKYAFEGTKLQCRGEVVKETSNELLVMMPIGDLYKFDRQTNAVKNNTQQLTIGEIYA